MEWVFHWEVCRDFIKEDFFPWGLKEPTEALLDELRGFGQSGSLSCLDRALGSLKKLLIDWDHGWWVAHRQATPWPLPEISSPWKVTRQAGWSRVVWACPHCQWEIGWQLELAAWERLEWPGAIDCPLCESASSDDPHLA